MVQSQPFTRYTLDVTGVPDEAAAIELREALERVPGLAAAEVDTAADQVEVVADDERVLGDARWVATDLGYEAT